MYRKTVFLTPTLRHHCGKRQQHRSTATQTTRRLKITLLCSFSYVLYACIPLICIIMGICALYVFRLSCKALWVSKSALEVPSSSSSSSSSSHQRKRSDKTVGTNKSSSNKLWKDNGKRRFLMVDVVHTSLFHTNDHAACSKPFRTWMQQTVSDVNA